MFRTLRRRLVPLAVLAAVLAIPLTEHAWQLYTAGQAAQAADLRAPARQYISGTPVRIVVPAAAINLAVVPGTQDPKIGVWPVAAKQANYATSTAPVNNRQGQTFIYGHNNHLVFKSLLGLKPNDKALVYTQNGHVFTYLFTGAHDVTPDQSSIFKTMQQGTGLVLMTCDGNRFEYRHLMQFRLVAAS